MGEVATPNLNTFVLNVDERTLEEAPKIDGGVLRAARNGEQRSSGAERYGESTSRQ